MEPGPGRSCSSVGRKCDFGLRAWRWENNGNAHHWWRLLDRGGTYYKCNGCGFVTRWPETYERATGQSVKPRYRWARDRAEFDPAYGER